MNEAKAIVGLKPMRTGLINIEPGMIAARTGLQLRELWADALPMSGQP